MKPFFQNLNIAHIRTQLVELVRRFPWPTLIICALTAVFVYSVNTGDDSGEIIRLILALITTFFLSLGISLFLEVKKEKYQSLLQLTAPLYGAIFYLTTPVAPQVWAGDLIPYFLLHLAGFISLIFFAPYCNFVISRKEKGITYSNYFSRTAWTLLMADIVGIALLALGAIAISTVVALFDLSEVIQDDKIYENWAIITLVFFAPLYGLMHFPKKNTLSQTTYEVNKFFSFLIRFIGIPFIVIYFIILYAYSVRVCLNFWDWPKGIISWMVIGFSTFGYLIYIFSKPYEGESVLTRLVRRALPWAVIFQLPMLGYAIWLRIVQYDFTVNRYFVIVFGIWLAIISLYYLVSSKKSLTIIPSTLTVIALIISVGPWGVVQFPLSRQYDRLIRDLRTAGMYVDGKVIPKSQPIDSRLESTIFEGIQYLCEYDECRVLKGLFSTQLTETIAKHENKWNTDELNTGKKYPGMLRWEIVEVIREYLKISYVSQLGYNNSIISLSPESSYKHDFSYFPLDVSGYTEILEVYVDAQTACAEKCGMVDIGKKTLTIVSQGEAGRLDEEVFSLQAFLDVLETKYAHHVGGPQEVNKTELTAVLEGNIYTAKVFFSHLDLPITKKTENDYSLYVKGYVMVRRK